MQECITINVLRDYLAGLVTPEVSYSLETHLQSCPACQALVARFTPQPEPLLQAARGTFADSAVEQEPELVSVLSVIGDFCSQANGDGGRITATQAASATAIREYRILKKLGEGGMGTVYLAIHTRLEKTVALKILKADRDRNPQAIARFEREMKAVGKLDHQHIVRALDAGDEDGTYFLVMEYIAGRDLGRLLQIKGRLRVPQACELIRQAALGLQHAHDHNLVHRDVKPSNLILSAGGQVKVLDLGLAHLQVTADDSSELTREGQLVGTWLYMAPEQLVPGNQVDSRSDIFSLGVTFYNFLAGELPLSRGQMATQLPAIGTQRDDVPPDVQTLLEKMLSPHPDQRIQTMSEVAQVLGNHTKGETIPMEEPEVVPPPIQLPLPVTVPTTRALDISRKYWRYLAAISAAAAALMLLVVVMNWPDPIKPVRNTSVPPPKPDGLITVVPAAKPGLALPPMFAVEKRDTKKTFPLGSGDNHVPPGTYYLVSEHPDLQLVPDEIDVARGSSIRVAVKQQPPLAWFFPSMPDQAGAFLEGSGTVWMEGMPEKDGIKEYLTYHLKLKMGGPGEDAFSRWLEVEVTTVRPGGDYTETGLLLVDIAEYRSSNTLHVKRGWLTGHSQGIKRRLKSLYGEDLSPKEPPSQLAVEFDNAADTLWERADELKVEFPAVRVGVQDALILLFGAKSYSRSPVSGVRDQLAEDSKRKKTREQVGNLYCWVVKSDEAFKSDERRTGYSFARHDDVPFNMVQIKVNLPKFIAGFNHTRFARTGTPPGDGAKVKDEVAICKSLQRHWVNFDEASLPKAEGAMAMHRVTITRGSTRGSIQQSFDVSLRMADAVKAGVPDRQLEVTVTSTTPGAEFSEEALLRVLDRRDKGGRFSVEEGWIRSQGEILPFELKGDRESLKLGLLKLGKRPAPSLLTIHDVLALLFGKQKNPGQVDALRAMVSNIISEHDLERDLKHIKTKLRNLDEVDAEVWTLKPKTPGSIRPESLDYEFFRNPEYPFDFLKMTFQLTGIFGLTGDLVTSAQKGAPTLLSVTDAEVPSLLAATADRIKAAEKNVNWREWGGEKELWREWAEFRGQLKDGTVLLMCKVEPTPALPDGEILLPFQSQNLRPEDRKWIEDGRTWQSAVGRASLRAAYVKMVGKKVIWKIDGEEQTPFDIGYLSAQDREWIEFLERKNKNLEKPKKRR